MALVRHAPAECSRVLSIRADAVYVHTGRSQAQLPSNQLLARAISMPVMAQTATEARTRFRHGKYQAAKDGDDSDHKRFSDMYLGVSAYPVCSTKWIGRKDDCA